MPFYSYQPVESSQCEYCETGFDYLQKVGAEPLQNCPECGVAVKKVITAPNLVGESPSLDEGNLSKHGFTQYRKLEKGVYEKTTGKGPKVISSKE